MSLGLFMDELWVCPNKDGATWRVVHHAFRYQCADETIITVPPGFVTDFASVPRGVWNMFPPWASYGWAAVIHDWLYKSQTTTKAVADLIFLEAMEMLGVPLTTRQILYHTVQFAGAAAWDAHTAEADRWRRLVTHQEKIL